MKAVNPPIIKVSSENPSLEQPTFTFSLFPNVEKLHSLTSDNQLPFPFSPKNLQKQ